uniref:Uncharacterized protein n=1 Tax=Clastoptera arizonana TaxID=38151 RepID=A0A1B6D530_9HEMI
MLNNMIKSVVYVCFLLSAFGTETGTDFQTTLSEKWRLLFKSIMEINPATRDPNMTQPEQLKRFLDIVRKGSKAMVYTMDHWAEVRCSNKTEVEKTLKLGLSHLYNMRPQDNLTEVEVEEMKVLLTRICDLHYMLYSNDAIKM